MNVAPRATAPGDERRDRATPLLDCRPSSSLRVRQACLAASSCRTTALCVAPLRTIAPGRAHSRGLDLDLMHCQSDLGSPATRPRRASHHYSPRDSARGLLSPLRRGHYSPRKPCAPRPATHATSFYHTLHNRHTTRDTPPHYTHHTTPTPHPHHTPDLNKHAESQYAREAQQPTAPRPPPLR